MAAVAGRVEAVVALPARLVAHLRRDVVALAERAAERVAAQQAALVERRVREHARGLRRPPPHRIGAAAQQEPRRRRGARGVAVRRLEADHEGRVAPGRFNIDIAGERGQQLRGAGDVAALARQV